MHTAITMKPTNHTLWSVFVAALACQGLGCNGTAVSWTAGDLVHHCVANAAGSQSGHHGVWCDVDERTVPAHHDYVSTMRSVMAALEKVTDFHMHVVIVGNANTFSLRSFSETVLRDLSARTVSTPDFVPYKPHRRAVLILVTTEQPNRFVLQLRACWLPRFHHRNLPAGRLRSSPVLTPHPSSQTTLPQR